MNLNWQKFTPSYLLSLDDQILPHTFLKLCVKSYLGESKNVRPDLDPLVSPSIASDEVIYYFAFKNSHFFVIF